MGLWLWKVSSIPYLLLPGVNWKERCNWERPAFLHKKKDQQNVSKPDSNIQRKGNPSWTSEADNTQCPCGCEWLAVHRPVMIPCNKQGCNEQIPCPEAPSRLGICIFPSCCELADSALNTECLARGLQARCDPSEVIAELREHFQSVRQDLASLTNIFISGQSAGWRLSGLLGFSREEIESLPLLWPMAFLALLAAASGGLQQQHAGEQAPETCASQNELYFTSINMSSQSPWVHMLCSKGNKFKVFLKSTCALPCF